MESINLINVQRIFMKIMLLSLFCISITSCGSTPLASPEIRQRSYIIESKNDKAKNYSIALAHLAKNVGDANHAIKVQDKAEGTIVMKGLVICNELKQLGAPDMNLEFNLTVNSKEQKVRMLFEDMEMTGPGSQWEYASLSSPERVEKVATCLTPFVEGLKKDLTGPSKADW
jgi:hypothetical protein